MLGWIAAVLLLLLAAVLLAPFFLTTVIVRVALRQIFPANTPSVGAAVLSFRGALAVRDLVLHDSGALTDQALITAREVDAEFNWKELFSVKIRRVRAHDVTLYERSNGRSQLSLLDLIFELSARPSSGTLPLWIGALDVQGIIRPEPIKGVVLANADWPLALQMTLSGDHVNPSRQLRVTVGDTRQLPDKMPEKPAPAGTASRPGADTAFGLRADIETEPAAAGTRLLIRRLAARQAALTIDADILRRYLPGFPAEVAGRIETNLASLWATGVFDAQGPVNGKQIAGRLAFSGLRVRVPNSSQMMLSLADLSGAVKIDTSLPPGPATSITVQWLQAANAKAWIKADALRHYKAKLPAELQGPIEIGLGNLQAFGELDPRKPANGQRLAASLAFAGFSVRIPGSSPVPGSSPIMLSLDDLSGAAKIDIALPPGPRTAITIERLRVANAKASIEADALRRRATKLPADWHGAVRANLAAMDLSGLIGPGSGAASGFRGNIRLQDLSVHSPAGGEHVLSLDRLTAAGVVESQLDRWAPAALRVRDGEVRWVALTYGNNAVNNLDAAGSVDRSTLTAQRCTAQLFDGQISGALVLDLATRAMPRCDFQIKSISMHEALANISPQHIDAEGTASGFLHLVASAAGELSGYVDLAFDGPGILKVGDIPKLNRMLASNFGLDMADLAMHDLKHYPFKQGRIHLESLGTNSQLKVRFVRKPRDTSAMTVPRKEIINGQEVTVGSLVVPVIDLTMPITGKSLAEILSMVGGIHPLIKAISDEHGD